MKDTPPDVEERYHRQLMSLTGEQRLAMAGRMFDAAKRLVLASISQDGPVSRQKARELLFLRFYGDDFTEDQRAKIIAHLRST